MENPQSLRYWLALNHVSGIGAATFTRLLQLFGDPENIFRQGRDDMLRFGISERIIKNIIGFDWSLIDKELLWLEQQTDLKVITLHHPQYPEQLRHIPDPPVLLYVRGTPAALSIQPQLAIIGSRTPTPTGSELAYEFAAQLAGFGFAITSGLALGVDGAAHLGALSAQGTTLAVMGTGADRIYPGSHRKLAEQIVQNGALITEYPPGSPPLAANFPRRNRIISGLSKGVLVVEAAMRSGSLITARLALDQGREVLAVPGSPRNMKAEGTNMLIKQGACVVTSAMDILAELGIEPSRLVSPLTDKNAGEEVELDAEANLVLAQVDTEPVSLDTVIQRSGLTAEKVSSILMALELQGLIQSTAGGGVCRAAKRISNERECARRIDVSI